MPDIAIQWDRASLARIESVIRQEIAVCGKTAEEAVKHAYIMFARSGRAATRLGVRKRQVFPNPDYVPRRGLHQQKAKFFIQYLYQSRPPYLAPTNSRSDPRRRIARRGLARASWGWMLRPVAKTPAQSIPGVAQHKIVKITSRTRGTNPFIAFVNRLMYMLKVHPDIGNRAMNAAARGMQHNLDNRMRAEMERLWHS